MLVGCGYVGDVLSFADESIDFTLDVPFLSLPSGREAQYCRHFL